MTHEIKPSITTRELLLVVDPSAKELIDLALSLGARRIPSGGYAIMPIRLRHWTRLKLHGFTAVRRAGGWKYYAPGDKRPLTLYDALYAAHRQEPNE